MLEDKPNDTTFPKLRVLILSDVIPVQRSGAGCLTMYRHFILNQDFEVAVAAARDFKIADVPTFRIQQDRVTERLRKTRFSRLVRNSDFIRNWHLLPSGLTSFAKSFKPDVIFSVVDDIHMGLAWRLSRKLGVPLAVDFQDLFAVSNFYPKIVSPYPWVKNYLLNKYCFLNRESDIVFHVGEGMHDWFGNEARGDILYPMASELERPTTEQENHGEEDTPFRILYTGNSRGAYGKMVLRFAKTTIDDPTIDFRIYALGTDIPGDELARLEEAGIYRGYLPFQELMSEMEQADAFLLVMGFEDNERAFVSTCFNTKWVDYVSFGKPIIVWGPEYASASRFANKQEAALAISTNDAEEVLSAFRRISNDSDLASQLGAGATLAAKGPLSPRRLQDLLKNRLISFVKQNNEERE